MRWKGETEEGGRRGEGGWRGEGSGEGREDGKGREGWKGEGGMEKEVKERIHELTDELEKRSVNKRHCTRNGG